MPWPGSNMVIVDSQAIERPAWSPLTTPSAAKPLPGKLKHREAELLRDTTLR
jgi:hypothetical protein